MTDAISLRYYKLREAGGMTCWNVVAEVNESANTMIYVVHTA
jgi:hypothetical protein